MNATTREFICEDCKYTIYSFGHDDGKNICGMCKWLKEFVKSEEKRERIIKLVREDNTDKIIN